MVITGLSGFPAESFSEPDHGSAGPNIFTATSITTSIRITGITVQCPTEGIGIAGRAIILPDTLTGISTVMKRATDAGMWNSMAAGMAIIPIKITEA
jgi:hypothetical protein